MALPLPLLGWQWPRSWQTQPGLWLGAASASLRVWSSLGCWERRLPPQLCSRLTCSENSGPQALRGRGSLSLAPRASPAPTTVSQSPPCWLCWGTMTRRQALGGGSEGSAGSRSPRRARGGQCPPAVCPSWPQRGGGSSPRLERLPLLAPAFASCSVSSVGGHGVHRAPQPVPVLAGGSRLSPGLDFVSGSPRCWRGLCVLLPG